MNYSTKKPHLIPFLEQFIAATVLFIVLPAALVFSDIIEIVIADKYRGFVITLILILYFYYLLALFQRISKVSVVGVDGVEGPPVPIPNTVVKLNSAENT